MRETPAEKLIELLRNAGAERRLPRPARAGVRRHDARSPLEPEAYDCVAIVTAHSAIDYADVVAPRAGRRRLPQRHAAATRSRARSGSSEPVRDRPGRARRLGHEPRPQLRRPRRPRAGSATPTEERRDAVRAPLPERARRRPTSTSCSPTPTLEAVVIATPVPTHYALAKQALEAGQARLRREAAGDARRRDGRARRARRGARPRADAGPPAALPPGRAQAEGARRLAASSATCSASTATARTSARSARTRTRSGRSASTTSR